MSGGDIINRATNRLAVQNISFGGALKGITITVSIGVATFPARRVDCVDSLFRQADEALYRAKQRGRNRVEAMLDDPA